MGGWYFIKGKFYAPLHGVTVKTSAFDSIFKRAKVSAYRFHSPPISYKNKIKVITHHGEFDQVKADYSSVAYYYQK